MLWSFRNKLKSLTDKDFLHYLSNRERFSIKHLSVIDQEARNRFFSNPDFNGEDDEYINPQSSYSQLIHRRHLLLNTSLAVFFVIIVAGAYLFLQYNDTGVSFFSSMNEEINEVTLAENNPPSKDIFVPVTQDSLPDSGSPILENEDEAKEPEIEKPSNSALKSNSKPEEFIQVEVDLTNNTSPADAKQQVIKSESIIEPESQNPQTSGDNEIADVAGQKLVTEAEPIKVKEQNQIVEEAKVKPKPEISKPEPAVVVNPAPTKSEVEAKTKEPLPSIADASELSISQLRKFIPFLNDWAYKQTHSKGIEDYFVENNSFVNFRLSKNYTDSVDVFQKVRKPQLIENYWKSLDGELGAEFPRIQIDIIFLKFDADL